MGGRLEPVTPGLTQRRRFKPEEGKQLTVKFDGEIALAEIQRVLNDDACVVKMLRMPTARNSQFKKDDIICVRRALDETLQTEYWRFIDDREMRQLMDVARFEREEDERLDREERERVAKVQAQHAAAFTATPVEPPKPKRAVLGPRRNKVSKVPGASA
jgi:hypothetical protein